MISRELTLQRWKEAQVLPARKAEHEHYAQLALAYKQNFYDPVAAAKGVPWYMVACFDRRESDCDHNAYLGNGDSLWHPTIHVPRGRGPFKSWSAGAIDSLNFDQVVPSKGEGNHWDIVTVLIAMEAWNGLGYFFRGLPSPYDWSGTNIQRPGKFTGDGEWDPHAWDTQPGCAAMLICLRDNHGVDLSEG